MLFRFLCMKVFFSNLFRIIRDYKILFVKLYVFCFYLSIYVNIFMLDVNYGIVNIYRLCG